MGMLAPMIANRTTPLAAILGVAALACGAGGCATASVAAVGTMAVIAASAISTGGDIYRLGKLDAADESRYDAWLAACRAAIADLHYTVEKESDKGDGLWICILRDDRRSRVDVTVERRTETICLTRVDVGVFGSEPTARLILTAIRRRAGHLTTTGQKTLNTEPAPHENH
jgi:hypothetical protein